MIHDPSKSQPVLEDFCNHLSAHICVLEMVLTSHKFNNPNFDPILDDPMILPVYEEQIRHKLRDCDYLDFLRNVLSKIEIPRNTLDIFYSHLDDNLFELFDVVIKKQKENFTIEEYSNGYLYHCPALVSDVLLPVISSLHSEIILTFEQFIDVINAVDGDAKRIFLNAKGSTAKSQFIQLWVAHHLGMSSGDYGGLIMVV
jgi:hypothetical protein